MHVFEETQISMRNKFKRFEMKSSARCNKMIVYLLLKSSSFCMSHEMSSKEWLFSNRIKVKISHDGTETESGKERE